VAFASDAGNILRIGDTNLLRDIFVCDRLMGTTARVSIGHQLQQANGVSEEPEISGDGSAVVFESTATNLTAVADGNDTKDVYLRDLKANTTIRVSRLAGGAPSLDYSNGPRSRGRADTSRSRPTRNSSRATRTLPPTSTDTTGLWTRCCW